MSLFDDVEELGNAGAVRNATVQSVSVTDPGAAGGSGFVSVTPTFGPNAYAGSWTVDDHHGHQVHVSPTFGPNAHLGGVTVDDGQGHVDHWMPLPGGGFYHP